MTTYDVEIKATVRKVVRVDGTNEQEAIEEAHSVFNVLEDGTDEWYEEEVLSITEVKSA